MFNDLKPSVSSSLHHSVQLCCMFGLFVCWCLNELTEPPPPLSPSKQNHSDMFPAYTYTNSHYHHCWEKRIVRERERERERERNWDRAKRKARRQYFLHICWKQVVSTNCNAGCCFCYIHNTHIMQPPYIHSAKTAIHIYNLSTAYVFCVNCALVDALVMHWWSMNRPPISCRIWYIHKYIYIIIILYVCLYIYIQNIECEWRHSFKSSVNVDDFMLMMIHCQSQLNIP